MSFPRKVPSQYTWDIGVYSCPSCHKLPYAEITYPDGWRSNYSYGCCSIRSSPQPYIVSAKLEWNNIIEEIFPLEKHVLEF